MFYRYLLEYDCIYSSGLRALKRISKPDRLNIYRAVRGHSNDDFWFIYGPALNSLLHKAKAENVAIAPAKV